MAKKETGREVEDVALDFNLDDEEISNIPLIKVEGEASESKSNIDRKNKKTKETEDSIINCLKNERIIVRHIPKESGMVTNPKHVLYGGMAEDAIRTFVVPRLSSGMLVNVLTDKEKDYLENIMGLEDNALSVYKKIDNFWDDSNENGISRVRLTKQDNYLNLADPEDYIRYKILLANKDFIAPSLQVLEDKPKATYQFVIISEGDEIKSDQATMDSTMNSYKEFGKIEDDTAKLRLIIEIISGRPVSPNTKKTFLQTQINKLIQADSKLFLRVVKDSLLDTKVLIKKSIEAGLIANRGNYLYLKENNMPLCNNGEEPTLNIAAKYLNLPKNQEIKFSLEGKVKEYEQ